VKQQYFIRQFIALRQINDGFNYWVESAFKLEGEKPPIKTWEHQFCQILKKFDHQRVDLSSTRLAETIFHALQSEGLPQVCEVTLYRGDGVVVNYRAQPMDGNVVEPPTPPAVKG
jgi:hypothetical protein